MINLLEKLQIHLILNTQKRLGFGGIIGVSIILGIFLTSGLVDLSDYVTGIAITLTGILAGIGYFTFRPEIERFIRGEPSEDISPIGLQSKQNELDKEKILDVTLNEIRRFVKDWGKRLPWDTGYRFLIRHYQICRYSIRISEQALRLQRTVKWLREAKITNSKNALDNFSTVSDKLVELGAEIEINCHKPTKDNPDHLRKFIKDGEGIIQDFEQVLKDLGKLRKKL